MRSAALSLFIVFGIHLPAANGAVEVSPPPIGVSIPATGGDVVSKGDGFLAVFVREYADWLAGLVALDRNGNRISDVRVSRRTSVHTSRVSTITISCPGSTIDLGRVCRAALPDRW